MCGSQIAQQEKNCLNRCRMPAYLMRGAILDRAALRVRKSYRALGMTVTEDFRLSIATLVGHSSGSTAPVR